MFLALSGEELDLFMVQLFPFTESKSKGRKELWGRIRPQSEGFKVTFSRKSEELCQPVKTHFGVKYGLEFLFSVFLFQFFKKFLLYFIYFFSTNSIEKLELCHS